jgi:flagellar protein FlbD
MNDWESPRSEGELRGSVHNSIPHEFKGSMYTWVILIKVTRLNGKEFVVNAELIQYVEATPDTVITLVNHEKLVVKEPVDEVVKRAVEYGRSLRMLP